MENEQPEDPLTTDGLVGSGYTPSSRRSSGTGSGMGQSGVYALLVLSLVAVAALGWFAFRAQTEIDTLRSQDQNVRGRLVEIETRLQITDEDRSRADTAIEGQIDFWEDEIRKLWSVSNERNRNWITQNQNSLKSQQSKLSEISKELDSLGATMARVEAGLQTQQQVVQRLDVLDRQITEYARSLRDAVDKTNTASITLARMESDASKLLKENAEFQASVDAFRLQVNRRLEELRGQMEGGRSSTPPDSSIGVVTE